MKSKKHRSKSYAIDVARWSEFRAPPSFRGCMATSGSRLTLGVVRGQTQGPKNGRFLRESGWDLGKNRPAGRALSLTNDRPKSTVSGTNRDHPAVWVKAASVRPFHRVKP
jgi:hypothetical protein